MAKALCFAAGLVLGIAGLLVVDAAFKGRSPGARRNSGSFAMAGFGVWAAAVMILTVSWFSGLLAG